MSSSRFGWRAVAYALLLGGVAVLLLLRWTELADVWRAHGPTFVAVTALMAVAIGVQARTFKSFLASAHRLSWPAMSGIWAISVLVNYLGPFQPGLAVRVAMLSRAGVSVPEASIATARQVFATLWLALPVAALSLLGVDAAKLVLPAIVLLAGFAFASQGLPLLRRIVSRALSRTRAGALAPHVASALTLPTLPSALGVLSQYVLSASVFYIGYRQFGVDITVAAAFGLACVVYASSVVALFPGNLGVLEALVTAFGRVNQLPVDEALALAFLFRGANIVGAVLLAAILMPRKRVAA